MREISSSCHVDIIDDSALITGVPDTARHWNYSASSGLSNFIGWLNKSLFLSPASLESRREIVIMYCGRTSDFLMMTSERMVIPTGRYTLGELLCSLYKRGGRWEYELDVSHLMCTINGRDVRLFDTIKPGDEICISSRKSIFEA